MKTHWTLLVAMALAGTLGAGSRKPARPHAQPAFDYYLLTLSYAPDFCAQPRGEKDPRECGAGRRVGFVVHGLWPQGERGRGPEYCGSDGQIPASTLREMLVYIPTESLIRHEWKAHGACSGLSAADYFTAVKKARDAVRIPAELAPSSERTFSPGEISDKVAAANPRYPRAAFRVTCYPDKQLQEIRVCLNKDLSPRACGGTAGRCAASSVTLLPTR
jgi:ribonuclease T2